jgi:hypothetical protein
MLLLLPFLNVNSKQNNMLEQTVVVWLEEVYNQQGRILPAQFEQAKEMFENQIMQAFDNGDHCIDLPDGSWKQKYDSPEQYYTETYKTK